METMPLKSVIESLLQRALHALPSSILPPDERAIDIEVRRTHDPERGDFASNLAMRLAAAARRSPRNLAQVLAGAVPADPVVDKIEIAGSGFMNFFLTDVAYHDEIARLLADPPIRPQPGPPWVVELLFPNPTDAAYAEHGRHAAYAATLANFLEAIGHAVVRECCVGGLGDAGRETVLASLRTDLEEFGVTFDSWHADPREPAVPRGQRRLRVSGAPGGAPPGRGTPDAPELHWVEAVSLARGARRMAARSGRSVTLRALREEVGNDAARLFYLMRSADQRLEFDLDLAQRRADDNPLYCIQYAHARVSSLRRQLADRALAHDRAQGVAAFGRLTQPEERSLVRQLGVFTETVEHCALYRAPHRLVHYLVDLAKGLHAYHRAHPLIVDDAALRDARITLACAAQTALRKGLALVGLKAPHTM
jgi:arginyl-tRNA synthetase